MKKLKDKTYLKLYSLTNKSCDQVKKEKAIQHVLVFFNVFLFSLLNLS